jgi:uncharacterized repeat protein (TIGR01451 family)
MSKHLSLAVVAHCAVLLVASPALASFHFMKVEEVIGGVNGDPTQQAIQLRMRAGGQNQLAPNATRLIVRDAAGANPVTLLVFPSNPSNAALGARILVVSPAFAAANPGIVADYQMTSLIPPSYLAAGRLTFENGSGFVVWSLAWGGSGYTGSNSGSTDNDADGNYGPPFASALPSSNNRALLFSTADPTGSALGTTNLANYALTTGPATFTNNAGATGTLPPLVNLGITKTDGLTTAMPGQGLTYTIVVSNTGPDSAVGATVTDTVPISLTAGAWTCSGTGGGTCTPAGSGNINTTATVPPGGTVTYSLQATVSLTPTSVANTATVAAPSGATDTNPSNNSATDVDSVICNVEPVVIPDGRATPATIAPGATAFFGTSLRIGNSYSVEVKNATGDAVPPGVLTVFRGDDGCGGASTLTTTNTAGVEPGESAGAARVSFTATGASTFYQLKLVNGGGTIPYTVTVSDTTLFSPAWSTNGAFDTFYSFQNTTGTGLNGTLTLLSTAGATISTFPVSIPAGQTASTNTASLSVTRNQAGTARFTHDGPPGAVVGEAAIANFSISPAYVQPVKIQSVPERSSPRAIVAAGPPGLASLGPTPTFARVGAVGNTFPAPLTVTLTGPAQGDTTVTLISGDMLALAVADVTVPNGATSAPVPVAGLATSPDVTVTATLGPQLQTAHVRVLGAAEAPSTVTLSPSDVAITAGDTVPYTVSLDIPALTTATVALAVAPPGAGTFPPSVAIPPNQISATFDYVDAATTAAATLTATFGATTSMSNITSSPGVNHLVINEVDYDQVGTDGAEFIEIYNPTGSPISLANKAVFLVNGEPIPPSTYDQIDLGPAISLPSHGYLVIAGPGVTVSLPAIKIDPGWTANAIQNGAPDGIALVDTLTHTLIDALSYEGAIATVPLPGFSGSSSLVEGTALSASIADSNSAEGSLCRDPSGQDTDNASSDWTFCTSPTPGTVNPVNP